jgi:hypothetical protein
MMFARFKLNVILMPEVAMMISARKLTQVSGSELDRAQLCGVHDALGVRSNLSESARRETI